MTENYFDIQDRFVSEMKAAREAGLFANPVYIPYFDWKFGKAPLSALTPAELRNIAEVVSDELEELDRRHPEAYMTLADAPSVGDIWKPYKGYGKDARIYACLSAIDSEVAKLLLIA